MALESNARVCDRLSLLLVVPVFPDAILIRRGTTRTSLSDPHRWQGDLRPEVHDPLGTRQPIRAHITLTLVPSPALHLVSTRSRPNSTRILSDRALHFAKRRLGGIMIAGDTGAELWVWMADGGLLV